MSKKYFTSESVSEGHPDKICDQISDAILDACLAQDPYSRVGCETMVKSNRVIVAGEVTTNSKFHVEEVVRKIIKDIGYTREEDGFCYKSCEILQFLTKQSQDIAHGIDESLEVREASANRLCSKKNFDGSKYEKIGAGDQGMMFGYATNETEVYMPAPIYYAHRLMKELADLRREKYEGKIKPDSKAQVTFVYENGVPVHLDTILISTMHSEEMKLSDLRKIIKNELIPRCIPANLDGDDVNILVNPSGRFVIGGPVADAGLTGRKVIVDTYGGFGRHGGGCFSGKEPNKVDRSASYMMRHVAKNIVANKLADRCEVQVAYAIGKAEPVSVFVETFGTNKIPEDEIEKIIHKNFDLRPAAIIDALDLRRPIYKKTAAYGHFGREDKDFTWEKVIELKE